MVSIEDGGRLAPWPASWAEPSATPETSSRPPEHVGEDLHPVGAREQRAAGGDDRLDAAERVEHRREPVADALERGLRDVERRRRERESRDRPAPVGVPAERPLAAEKRQEDEAVRGRRALGEPGVGVAQRRERARRAGCRRPRARRPRRTGARRGGRGRAPGAARRRPRRRRRAPPPRCRSSARPDSASCSPRRRSSRRRRRAPDGHRRPARPRAAGAGPVDAERSERLVVPVEPIGIEEARAAGRSRRSCEPRPSAGSR